MSIENKNHWDHVYQTKSSNEVSWTQEVPQTSLDFIKSFNLPKTAKIIDIGGGDSKLVDNLLEEGYTNLSVLDISKEALEKCKWRLGQKADLVTWIISDITSFHPSTTYDVWHDRATFHFLTSPEDICKYFSIANHAVKGFLTIGTFSTNGPEKCSGLEIKRYNEEQLSAIFSKSFKKNYCITEDHTTPFNTIQNFTFCSFKRLLNT